MIHDALRLLRRFYGLKQKDVAVKLGLSPSHLSEIEKGTKPVGYELLERYAQVFEMPVSSITMFAELSASDHTGVSKLKNVISEKALKLLDWLDSVSSLNEEIRATSSENQKS